MESAEINTSVIGNAQGVQSHGTALSGKEVHHMRSKVRINILSKTNNGRNNSVINVAKAMTAKYAG